MPNISPMWKGGLLLLASFVICLDAVVLVFADGHHVHLVHALTFAHGAVWALAVQALFKMWPRSRTVNKPDMPTNADLKSRGVKLRF